MVNIFIHKQIQGNFFFKLLTFYKKLVLFNNIIYFSSKYNVVKEKKFSILLCAVVRDVFFQLFFIIDNSIQKPKNQ